MILPTVLPAALCLLTLVSAATNHSIDDLDSLFQYSDGWEINTKNLNSTGGNLDIDGGHHLATIPGLSANITYTFASVYFLAARWPYKVTTNYRIDESTTLTIDMQDHSVPATTPDKNATVPSGVVGHWTSTTNQQHTIYITIPSGDSFAVVDMFIFEVLDPISSASQQTSSSPGITSMTVSSSSSSVPTSPSSSSSGSHGPSTAEVRGVAISIGVSLALLFILLLWWFCIRRKDKNDENKNSVMPRYHPLVSTSGIGGDGQDSNPPSGVFSESIPGMRESPIYTRVNNTNVPSEDNSARGIQNIDQQSMSSLPGSLLLPASPIPSQGTRNIPHDPRSSLATSSMTIDSLAKYSYNSILDGSTAASSSSGDRSTNKKSMDFDLYSQIPANTPFTEGDESKNEITSTTISGRHERNDSVWDSGYPQPLKFVSIL